MELGQVVELCRTVYEYALSSLHFLDIVAIVGIVYRTIRAKRWTYVHLWFVHHFLLEEGEDHETE